MLSTTIIITFIHVAQSEADITKSFTQENKSMNKKTKEKLATSTANENLHMSRAANAHEYARTFRKLHKKVIEIVLRMLYFQNHHKATQFFIYFKEDFAS